MKKPRFVVVLFCYVTTLFVVENCLFVDQFLLFLRAKERRTKEYSTR